MGATSTNQPSDLMILHREFTGDLCVLLAYTVRMPDDEKPHC